MKNIPILILICISITAHAQIENLPLRKNNISAGFKLMNSGGDFAFGAELTSPFFFHKHVTVRANVTQQYYSNTDQTLGTNLWTPYTTAKLGVVGVGGTPVPFLRMYGEGGFTTTFANSDISTTEMSTGAYGWFGFEFFMSSEETESFSYYIELGGIYSNIRAEKLPNRPIYNNGFVAGTGFRFYF